jgi:hypothetical protein
MSEGLSVGGEQNLSKISSLPVETAPGQPINRYKLYWGLIEVGKTF